MRRYIAITTILLALAAAPGLQADIIHVPGDQPTIQAGIDASSNGDTVLVADGTYTGAGNRDLDFGGRAITVASEDGPAACVIDCEDAARGFVFDSGEGETSVVEGFTITRGRSGYGMDGGGGICCDGASPTITGNTIIDNEAVANGGGIACINGASPLIIGNTIQDNLEWEDCGGGIFIDDASSPIVAGNTILGNGTWYAYGAGICCRGSALISGNLIAENYVTVHSDGGAAGISCGTNPVEITDNVIRDNTAWLAEGPGGGIYGAGPMTIANCLIIGNRSYEPGGGVYCDYGSTVTMTNCTVAGNESNTGGAGIHLAGGASVTVVNGIVWNNIGTEIFGTAAVTYSDVEGGCTGTGNINADPVFVTGPGGDYYLAHLATGQPLDSPCVDAGSGPASSICFNTPEGTVCLDELATRTDGVPDAETVDMGYHYSATTAQGTVAANLTCSPTSGTVPFTVNMGVVLTNTCAGQVRRIAGHIDVSLANGIVVPNWKSGYSNVAAGGSLVQMWSTAFPVSSWVIGRNVFQLIAEDVTPAPFNQPPYPPSGDTSTDSCAVTLALP